MCVEEYKSNSYSYTAVYSCKNEMDKAIAL